MNTPTTISPMTFRLKFSIAAYITVLNVGLLTTLILLWPGEGSPVGLQNDRRFLLLAVIAGALGSYIHLASSFVEHAGRQCLDATWAWWYFLRPMVGSALAMIVYFVLRAGLISGTTAEGTNTLNPYGIAAISALSGMFSRQATEKLRDVFGKLCSVEETKEELKHLREQVDEP